MQKQGFLTEKGKMLIMMRRLDTAVDQNIDNIVNQLI